MELWMSIVGISMALGGIPQIIKLLKRKTSEDISLLLWIIIIHGVAWWFCYGILIDSLSLIITNGICFIVDLVILLLIVRYRRRRYCNGQI